MKKHQFKPTMSDLMAEMTAIAKMWQVKPRSIKRTKMLLDKLAETLDAIHQKRKHK